MTRCGDGLCKVPPRELHQASGPDLFDPGTHREKNARGLSLSRTPRPLRSRTPPTPRGCTKPRLDVRRFVSQVRHVRLEVGTCHENRRGRAQVPVPVVADGDERAEHFLVVVLSDALETVRVELEALEQHAQLPRAPFECVGVVRGEDERYRGGGARPVRWGLGRNQW